MFIVTYHTITKCWVKNKTINTFHYIPTVDLFQLIKKQSLFCCRYHELKIFGLLTVSQTLYKISEAISSSFIQHMHATYW